MRIKCVVIQDLADDFEQLQRLTSAAGLVLLSQYFDDKCDRKAILAAPHEVEQAYWDWSGTSRVWRREGLRSAAHSHLPCTEMAWQIRYPKGCSAVEVFTEDPRPEDPGPVRVRVYILNGQPGPGRVPIYYFGSRVFLTYPSRSENTAPVSDQCQLACVCFVTCSL